MKLSELNLVKPLPKGFFNQSTIKVAQSLLGKVLVRGFGNQKIIVQIIETEAYLQDDPASHSFKGETVRNASMFESAGTCYVYLSYGMHYCMNVVTGPKGVGEAVLIRAAIPIVGHAMIAKNRKGVKPSLWLNGPGKLTQALMIDRSLNGTRFSEGPLSLGEIGVKVVCSAITPRVGISLGKELLLRFVDKKSSVGGRLVHGS